MREEFATRMKAARRAVKRVARKNPAKFDRCVKGVKRSLKRYRRKGNAYAICTASGARSKRRTARNPVLKPGFYLVAKRGKQTLYFIGKQKFSAARSLAKRYASKNSVLFTGADMRYRYAQSLAGYKLYVMTV